MLEWPARHASQLAGVAGRWNGFTITMYYTYVLRSTKDNNLYVGWSNDLKSRIKKHLDGKVKATKDRRPLILVYYEACLSENRAISREKYFRTGFGRGFIKNRI